MTTPRAASLSSRACTVPRASLSRRLASSTPDAGLLGEQRQDRGVHLVDRHGVGHLDHPFPRRLDDLISDAGRTIVLIGRLWDVSWATCRIDVRLVTLRAMTQTADRSAVSPDTDVTAVVPDPFPVHGMDAIVFVVGNATQAAHYYQTAFGMELVAYRRPGARQPRPQGVTCSQSGSIRFVLNGRGHARTARWLDHHRHARRRRRRPRARGARRRPLHRARPSRTARTVLEEPHDVTDEHGTVAVAAIATYGETRHTLVDRSRYAGPYLPGLRRRSAGCVSAPARRSGSSRRSTTASATSSSARWTSGSTFYNRVMGFTNMAEFVGDDIATDYSALMSKVVANGNHRVKFPLNEPAIAQEEVADRRVPRVLRRPRCAAPRARDRRHPRHRRRAARRRRRVPRDARLLLRRPRAARPHRRGPRADRGAARRAGSSSTATRTATCCRSSPSRVGTARRCSSS